MPAQAFCGLSELASTCLERHTMTHAPADVRLCDVCTDLNSSTSHYEKQLKAALHRAYAADAARRGGSDVAALEKALSAHTHAAPRLLVLLKHCWSAAAASVGRTRLAPACGRWPQHQYRGWGCLWRTGMAVACVFMNRYFVPHLGMQIIFKD